MNKQLVLAITHISTCFSDVASSWLVTRLVAYIFRVSGRSFLSWLKIDGHYIISVNASAASSLVFFSQYITHSICGVPGLVGQLTPELVYHLQQGLDLQKPSYHLQKLVSIAKKWKQMVC